MIDYWCHCPVLVHEQTSCHWQLVKSNARRMCWRILFCIASDFLFLLSFRYLSLDLWFRLHQYAGCLPLWWMLDMQISGMLHDSQDCTILAGLGTLNTQIPIHLCISNSNQTWVHRDFGQLLGLPGSHCAPWGLYQLTKHQSRRIRELIHMADQLNCLTEAPVSTWDC